MIKIKLLGGAKKAVGKSAIDMERSSASIAEILKFLQGVSIRPQILHAENLIVAINGVDSGALQGLATQVESDDAVTIVTVVHGGGDGIAIINDYPCLNVSVIGVSNISEEAITLIDRIRDSNTEVTLQALNADAVYGMDHILGAIRIMREAEKRGIMLANKREVDLLMRIALTDQISKAIRRAGLSKGRPACFIALSDTNNGLPKFSEYINSHFNVDNSVLQPNEEKRARLSALLGIKRHFSRVEFLQYLLERAAILVKS